MTLSIAFGITSRCRVFDGGKVENSKIGIFRIQVFDARTGNFPEGVLVISKVTLSITNAKESEYSQVRIPCDYLSSNRNHICHILNPSIDGLANAPSDIDRPNSRTTSGHSGHRGGNLDR